jgi:hypothetical protein
MKRARSLFAELKEGVDALKSAREGATSLRTVTVEANQHIGSSFDDFLSAEGRLAEATAAAQEKIKRLKS